MMIDPLELPLIVSQMEKQKVLEQRVTQAVQAFQQCKSDLNVFMQAKYGVDIESGDWELDLKTGELRCTSGDVRRPQSEIEK